MVVMVDRAGMDSTPREDTLVDMIAITTLHHSPQLVRLVGIAGVHGGQQFEASYLCYCYAKHSSFGCAMYKIVASHVTLPIALHHICDQCVHYKMSPFCM